MTIAKLYTRLSVKTFPKDTVVTFSSQQQANSNICWHVSCYQNVICLEWSLVLVPLVWSAIMDSSAVFGQTCTDWPDDAHHMSSLSILLATHVPLSYPCTSPWELLLSGSPTFVLPSPGAALPGALSQACQPGSFQWLSILTSCLQSGWAIRARRLSPTGCERADTASAFWSGCDGNAIKTGPSAPLAIVCMGLQSWTKHMMFRVMFNSSARCCYCWVWGEAGEKRCQLHGLNDKIWNVCLCVTICNLHWCHETNYG